MKPGAYLHAFLRDKYPLEINHGDYDKSVSGTKSGSHHIFQEGSQQIILALLFGVFTKTVQPSVPYNEDFVSLASVSMQAISHDNHV